MHETPNVQTKGHDFRKGIVRNDHYYNVVTAIAHFETIDNLQNVAATHTHRAQISKTSMFFRTRSIFYSLLTKLNECTVALRILKIGNAKLHNIICNYIKKSCEVRYFEGISVVLVLWNIFELIKGDCFENSNDGRTGKSISEMDE